MRSKKEITDSINGFEFPAVIPYADFFEGNDYARTIGVNIYPEPVPAQKFYMVFQGLIDSGLANEVFIPISDVNDPPEWFYADSVYIVGKITKDQLLKETASLKPDEIHEGLLYGKPSNITLKT